MKCVNAKTGKIIASDLEMKASFLGRLIGLLGKKSLKEGQGIVLKPCSQIHTCFMRFNIDAVFISKDFKVLKIIKDMRSWHFSPIVLKSLYTLEVAAGAIKDLSEGDYIKFTD
ncbi:MAG: DUF192 domain-containing protein [Elusimicrobiaceae bacterium]|nr:DUF192 domain-containing protein [Elusimicrobiaceae bacterium]MBQ6223727.1 DUF192 domain-containing protein [Campylobacter sp.]